MNVLPQRITPLQCRDTALALVFLCLLVWFFTKNDYWIWGGAGLCLLVMVWPASMTWPAKLWFGLALALGAVMSRVLLTVIYVCLVLPVALLRRLLGKDAMRLRQYRPQERREAAGDAASAFVVREHQYGAEDLRAPY